MAYDKCVGYEGFECPVEKTGGQRLRARCRSCAHKGNTGGAGNKGKTKSPEHCAKLSAAKLGNTGGAGNKGKTHSPEAIEKMRAASTGVTHSSETREKMRASASGKIQTLEHRRNVSLAHGGNGDVENRRYPGLHRWIASVKRTFTCCVVCRSTEMLEAHHIAAKAKYPELATFALNGLTLCKTCHSAVHYPLLDTLA